MTQNADRHPATAKRRMPAEWEPQAAIWLAWPDNIETWPENLREAQIEFSALVGTLAEMVTVQVMVNAASLEQAQASLIHPDTQRVFLVDIPTNDAWVRDTGPTFVIQEGTQHLAIDWDYNAWGGKYPPYDRDQQVASRIAAGMDVERIRPELCFEGGAIESNGAGIILSTVSCATDPQRNPGFSAAELQRAFESTFDRFLGAETTIWIPGQAIEGDDTDGHIDQLMRFTDPRTIVYATCTEATDPQAAGLAENHNILKRSLAELGAEFQLIPLPLPASLEMHGRRVPASYCNFLITDGLVVVPQFGDPQDEVALERLRPLFPDRHVMGLPSRHLSVGLGSFHCLSQQVPAIQTATETDANVVSIAPERDA